MVRTLIFAGLVVVAAGLFTAAQARQAEGDRWVLIATREVDFGKDIDTIDVSKSKGTFKALRLESKPSGHKPEGKRGHILIFNVTVKYGDGHVHNESRNFTLSQGKRTRAIDPSGEERVIDSVTLSYSYRGKPSAGRKGLIEVYALQSSAGANAESLIAGAAGTADPTSPDPNTAQPVTAATTLPETNDTKPDAGAAVTIAAISPEPSNAKHAPVTGGSDVLFGAHAVGFGADRAVIRVGSEVGKFDRIRLRVLENDVFLNELKVVYADGDPDIVAVNAEIKYNTRTRWFQVQGERFIQEIELTYRPRPDVKGHARVEVWGEFAEGWLGPRGEGHKYNEGWVLLGAQTAGFVSFENDLIPVGRNEGGFKKLRVAVKDRAITLGELRVVYDGGQEDIIPVEKKISPGSTYGPIALKRGANTIREIRARYRSRSLDRLGNGRGAAIVEVWGQH